MPKTTNVSASKNSTPETVKQSFEAILEGYQMKSIECPEYLLPVAGMEKGDILRCFVSMHEPEDLIPALTKDLSLIADEDMAWRKDIGTWSSTYKIKNSMLTAGMDIKAPGLSEYMRNDPNVRKYKSVLKYDISAPRVNK